MILEINTNIIILHRIQGLLHNISSLITILDHAIVTGPEVQGIHKEPLIVTSRDQKRTGIGPNPGRRTRMVTGRLPVFREKPS